MLLDAQRVISRARGIVCTNSPYKVTLRVQTVVYVHVRSELAAMQQLHALSAPPPRAPHIRME